MSRLGVAQAAIALALGVLAAAPAQAETFRRHADHVLGTSLDIAVTADEEGAADRAEAAIRAEIDRLAGVLSTWDPDSEISRLNAASEADVLADLGAVLAACEDWRTLTDGAFSCRIGRLVEAWRRADETDTPPERSAMRLLAGGIGRAEVVVDASGGRVVRPETVVFEVDGIATGYIVDKALAAARAAAPEARGVLIDIGGDIIAWGEGEGGGPWRVGVAAPERPEDNADAEVTLEVTGRAVTTSGRGPRDLEIAGAAYGHILSPESGWPADQARAATVVAPDAMTADALATSLLVMPLADGLAFAEEQDGVEALIVAADGRRHSTSGWTALTAGETAAETAEAGGAAPGGLALQVDLEIPTIDVGDYERPYVAVWIGDAERKLVRVLALWGEEPRWREENYVWQRRFERYAGSLPDAVARPTRPPGAYSFVWDGLKDDGSAAAPGAYVLHVEASREHGGHQYESLDFAVGDAPFEASIAAGAELGAIAVRYGLIE